MKTVTLELEEEYIEECDQFYGDSSYSYRLADHVIKQWKKQNNPK